MGRVLTVVGAIALCACDGDAPAGPADGAAATCSAEVAGCDLAPTPACFGYPAGPYGTRVGDRIEDFVLDDCDGAPVAFGQLLSQAELVLFNVGAGWCIPCIEETATLDAEIFRAFCGRGLRVVQVLFEDDELLPVTSLYCQGWRDRYSLSFPVLRDPLFTTERYFTDHAVETPLNLLVDRDGVIVYREAGTNAEGLAAEIDARLP